MCLGFSLQILSETFLILRTTQRDITINVHRSSCNVSCQIKKLQFSRQTFEKHSNVKIHENPSIWSPVVPCGQTDGQT